MNSCYLLYGKKIVCFSLIGNSKYILLNFASSPKYGCEETVAVLTAIQQLHVSDCI